VVVALGGIDAALEAREGFGAVVEDAADGLGLGRIVIVIVKEGAAVLGGPGPEEGLGFAEAAELPLGRDKGVNQTAGVGRGGVESGVVVLGEGGEIGGGLVGEDLGGGVDAGLEGVEAGGVLALGSARAGGVPGVAPVGGDLFACSHEQFLARG
jgi:hypothetical protein